MSVQPTSNEHEFFHSMILFTKRTKRTAARQSTMPTSFLGVTGLDDGGSVVYGHE